MIGLLRSLQRTVGPKPLEPSRLLVGEEVLDVVFRRHAQARRLVLRLNATGTGVLVTVPRGVSRARALEFTERSRNWIEDRVRARGGLIHLEDGAALPLRGIEHDIRNNFSRIILSRTTIMFKALLNKVDFYKFEICIYFILATSNGRMYG